MGKSEHIRFGIARENKFITIHNGIELEKYINLNVDILAKKERVRSKH